MAAEHLKFWEAMLGAKVAGSPWSNASNDAPTAEATDVVKSAGCLMQKTTSYWKKMGRNNGRNTLDQTK